MAHASFRFETMARRNIDAEPLIADVEASSEGGAPQVIDMPVVVHG